MQVETRKASPLAERPAEPPKHVHPAGVRNVDMGRDDRDGRRIIGTEPARTATYLFSCKACQADDQKRMAEPSALLNLDKTLFLIPEDEYSAWVARAYLAKRFGEDEAAVLNVVNNFNAEKLSHVRGAQIVVITRRPPTGKLPGNRYKRMKDEEGTFHDAPVPPETYLYEIVESEPVIVQECMEVRHADMFNDQSVDASELVYRLAERAYPYRIQPPNHPDKMYVMRANT